ncbi:MAG: DNA repair protein RecN [Candidatus Symbiothrix sp.]|nr:DNA repair protein RecN [Candidatus Symbiothrix sp.]
MLKSLYIQNYALISHLEIEFAQGLSVITGETGAGKSIILGALSLILGQRADIQAIKPGENKCVIEGIFDISAYRLETFFAERDLDYDAQQCILRREIRNTGNSRAFINDCPVGLSDLRTLGNALIDVHSQHHNLLLGESAFQLQSLDALAANQSLRLKYLEEYNRYTDLRKQLSELREKATQQASELDYLTFQYRQLDEANLKGGEQAALEEEQQTLAHVEEIKAVLFALDTALTDDSRERGMLATLKTSVSEMQGVAGKFTPAQAMSERLQSIYLDLKDLSMEISRHQENLESNPARLQEIIARLDLLYALQQKHRAENAEQLIALRDDLNRQLTAIANYDHEIEQLQTATDETFKHVEQTASELSATRHKAAKLLAQRLIERVSVLGMPSMQFQCRITPKNHLDKSGADDVCFMFSANKNMPLKAVADTASGGEISRLMLGVKALIAGATALPAIVFDEIDAGVSGDIADRMGKIMREMASDLQVIVITHLPQIAAQGDAHFLVYKQEHQSTVETNIRLLNATERIGEIARMLSGSAITSAAIENAKVLLKSSQL